jgi:hypothetical protein
MNELIQQLAEQATTIEYGVDNGFDNVIFDKEKFAELIIIKCLTICEELGDEGKDGHYCADKISKTFGRR